MFWSVVRGRHAVVLALTVTGLLHLEVWTWNVPLPERAVAAAAGTLLTVSLAWRVCAPLLVLGLTIAVLVATMLGLPPVDETGGFALAFLTGLYSVGAHTRGRGAVVGVAGAVVLGVLSFVQDPDPYTLSNAGFFVMLVGGPWAAGRAMQHRRAQEAALKRRTVELEQTQEEKARTAVVEERSRIARELHDIVAHALSVMVLQARGGRTVLATDPHEARQAFDTIEATGREALTEARRLVGMLRVDDEGIALAPQPSLAYLDQLIARVTAAGLPVELVVEGQVVDLPAGIDLSAYRIIQEALTNALKHAGPATAQVVVRYQPHELALEILDTGTHRSATDSSGQGLVGMQERAALYGGAVQAAPAPVGFTVRARLPLDDNP